MEALASRWLIYKQRGSISSKKLEGHMIRICSWCNSTLDWSTKFKGKTHGICPNCLRKHFPDEAEGIIWAMARC